MTTSIIKAFRIAEVAATHFIAEWQTNVPCHARIQISTSRSMVNAMPVGEAFTQHFRYDSRGKDGAARLPAMGRYWVRALVEDANGNQAASEIIEVLIPEDHAIQNVLVYSLGGDCAAVSWHSAELTIGQACFTAPDGCVICSTFESGLRENHCVTVSGLTPGESYSVRIRQGLEREKWADQFLRSEPRAFTQPSAVDSFPYTIPAAPDWLCLCHERLRLLVSIHGEIRAFLVDGGDPCTVMERANNRSAFSVTLADGTVLDQFPLAANVSAAERTRSVLGDAFRVIVSGEAEIPGGGRIRRRIEIDLYDEHPDAAVVRVSYAAGDGGELAIQQLEHLRLQLDRRLAYRGNQRVEPWHFHAYLPVSHTENFGETYTAIKLMPRFKQENRLAGDAAESAHHCGVPCFDFWSQEMGIAIGHLSDVPIPVSIPVCVNDEGHVEVCVREEDWLVPDEQGAYHSPPLFLIVHRLDFYAGVTRFRQLMAARGVQMPTPPTAAFEPVWSTWGYASSFTKNDIRKSLPLLKELGIRWIQFDDPWYADHGDMTVNPSVFPGGAADMTDFITELREEGFSIRLWVCSGHVSKNAPYALAHPGRLIQSSNGENTIIRSAGAPHTEYEMCPCIPENKAFSLATLEQFFLEYGVSGIYQDGVYGCPTCHHDGHDHDSPFDTLAAHAALYRNAYTRLMEITDGEAVVMLCTCGKVPDFYLLPSVNRVATADPMPIHVRKRVKSLKALLGSGAAVDFDFIELSANDFASAVGTGAALYLKFTAPLDLSEKDHYLKWMQIAQEHDLARGEYLNLYDIVHDLPETHVIRQNNRLYYAFYASQWSGDFTTPFAGRVEFRGLSPDVDYAVQDYVNQKSIGVINQRKPYLSVDFLGSLLVYAEAQPRS